MSQEAEKTYRTSVHLTFPPSVSGTPLVCNLTRLFDLDFSISTARITPRQEGVLTLELYGSQDACNKGIAYLRERDIQVSS
ncbi:MAG: NIL domain-containing protein, partial [Bilophila sp.]